MKILKKYYQIYIIDENKQNQLINKEIIIFKKKILIHFDKEDQKIIIFGMNNLQINELNQIKIMINHIYKKILKKYFIYFKILIYKILRNDVKIKNSVIKNG